MSIIDDIKEQFQILSEDFEARARTRLPTQFKESDKMLATINLYQAQLTQIKYAITELLTERWLQNATGKHLDLIGEWVGQERIDIGLTELFDSLYRSFIESRAIANISYNTLPAIYYHISSVMGRKDFYIESYQATMNIFFLTDYSLFFDSTNNFGYGEDDFGYTKGHYSAYLNTSFFNYKWTDNIGHEHDFFPIPLGVGRKIFQARGLIFGYGENDHGYGVGFYIAEIIFP